VFSWSYHALSPDAARLFRLLGLHPGPGIAIAAAASLAAIPPEQTRTLLTKLTRAHLLSEHVPGRYSFHDLLRAYATEQARTHDSDHARHAATHRILDHYLHTAHAAAALVKSQRDRLDLAPPQPGVTPEHLDSHDGALAWFNAEHATLLAAVHHAADAGFGTHPWQLAWALRTFLHRLGLHSVQVTIERRALEACRDSDQLGQAHASYGLAYGYLLSGCVDDASALFWHQVRLYKALGDPAGQADAHYGLAEVAGMQDRPADALRHAQQALDLYQATGNQHEQAQALNAIGCNHASLGDYQQALACCEQALGVLQELGDTAGQANTWDSLGYVHRGQADYQQAISCYQRAISLFQGLGYQYFEAGTLARLGDTHFAAGDHPAAHTAWHHALRVFDQIDHPDGDQLRAKLHPHGDQLHNCRRSQPPGYRGNGQAAGKMPAR
jgi:tetratricopeptide (TPR) repeat protein